jgi:hypothetical protein
VDYGDTAIGTQDETARVEDVADRLDGATHGRRNGPTCKCRSGGLGRGDYFFDRDPRTTSGSAGSGIFPNALDRTRGVINLCLRIVKTNIHFAKSGRYPGTANHREVCGEAGAVESIDGGGRDAGSFADTLAARKLTGLIRDQAGPWCAWQAHRRWGWHH